jgi:hypothetical protein
LDLTPPDLIVALRRNDPLPALAASLHASTRLKPSVRSLLIEYSNLRRSLLERRLSEEISGFFNKAVPNLVAGVAQSDSKVKIGPL